MGKDPIVKTIKHAKSLSLRKWHKARKDLEALLNFISQPCGFCFLTEQRTGVRHRGGCILCHVQSKCHELDKQVFIFLDGSLKYIKQDLIPYIENFELNGEAS